MTNDYKERLLQYLTNNFMVGTPSTTPFFASDIVQKNISQNIYTVMDPVGYIQGKDAKGNDLEVGFVYGTDVNNSNRGVVCVLDNNFNVVQTIRKFSSGDYLSPFIYLNIDAETGQIFGLDWKESKHRFIQLNNFLLKKPVQQYEIKIRNTAYIVNDPSSSNLNNVNFTYIEKNPATNLYILIGYGIYNNVGEEAPFVATYRVVVGEQNEIVFYPYKTQVAQDYIPQIQNVSWSGEDYTIKIGTYYTATNLYYQEFTLQSGDTGLTLGANVELSAAELSGYTLGIDDIEMTNNKTYISVGGSKVGGAITAIGSINYSNNTFSVVFTLLSASGLNYYETRTVLTRKNNTIYFNARTNENAPNNPILTSYKVQMGLINSNGDVLYKQKAGFYLYGYQNQLFNVMQNYNLLTYHMLGEKTTCLELIQVYNDNNYNYDDYQAYNSLKPNSALVYSNNNIVFARNLYNMTINGNTTGATVEIPNNILNGIQLKPQQLLGETNGILVNNQAPIEKNIYEDLFINFYNTITIQNQNSDQYIKNLDGSVRLNNSVSNDLDYTAATITKAKVRYNDNTSYIFPVLATQVSQYVYNYQIGVYSQKKIVGIDLISNDETTTYQTIDGSNFETNTFYLVNQQVKII